MGGGEGRGEKKKKGIGGCQLTSREKVTWGGHTVGFLTSAWEGITSLEVCTVDWRGVKVTVDAIAQKKIRDRTKREGDRV